MWQNERTRAAGAKPGEAGRAGEAGERWRSKSALALGSSVLRMVNLNLLAKFLCFLIRDELSRIQTTVQVPLKRHPRMSMGLGSHSL